jgi:phage portal protein BeeE
LRNERNNVIGFQPLDPRSIIVRADKYGDILSYKQTLNGSMIEFTKDEIIHFYEELDPDNELIGMSRVESLITELLTDDEASLSNYYFFKNSSIPGQVIILDEQLSDSEQDLAVEQIRAQFGGTKNKHKLMALG